MARDRNAIARSGFLQGLKALGSMGRTKGGLMVPDGAGGDRPPMVLCCIHSKEMVWTDFMISLANMCMAPQGAQIAFCSTRGRTTQGRNNAVESAKALGATHVWFIDPMFILTQDTLARLLSHDTDIMGAIFRQPSPPYRLSGNTLSGESEDTKDAKVWEMQEIPMACVLVKMPVFERMTRPYFRQAVDEEKGIDYPESTHFSKVARELGYKIMVDLEASDQIQSLGQAAWSMSAQQEAAQPEAANEQVAGGAATVS